jgi:hypothetical protein
VEQKAQRGAQRAAAGRIAQREALKDQGQLLGELNRDVSQRSRSTRSSSIETK